jgi:hypothetical protein
MKYRLRHVVSVSVHNWSTETIVYKTRRVGVLHIRDQQAQLSNESHAECVRIRVLHLHASSAVHWCPEWHGSNLTTQRLRMGGDSGTMAVCGRSVGRNIGNQNSKLMLVHTIATPLYNCILKVSHS